MERKDLERQQILEQQREQARIATEQKRAAKEAQIAQAKQNEAQ